jgi:vancomycin resistance protein YoaR
MRISRRTILLFAGSGVLGGAAAAAAGAATFVAVGEARYTHRFYPGVQLDGEDVGGLTLDQARVRLRERWDDFGRSPVVFRLDGRTWNPTGREVGIAVDYETPLAQAYAWGRRGSWESRLRQQRETLDAPRGWRTSVSFDPHAFMEFVDRIAAEVAERPVDASLRIETQGGQRRARVFPSREGRELVPADVLTVMSRRFETPQRLIIDLQSRVVAPRVSTDAVTSTAEYARELMDGHIEVVAPGHRWSIAREALAEDMRVVGPATAPEISVDVSYRAFDRVAREIADTLRVAAVEPKIRVDADGMVVPLVEGTPGRTIDAENLWTRVQTAFTSGSDRVNVPLVVLAPSIGRLSAEELQFDNLIAQGVSRFTGSSSNRVHNINNGSRLIDGAVVPPGETFSFNATVGPITAGNGFVEGLVIAPTRTEPGIGGGICQVSTTLFRAAFWAGLPISERWQHAYRVGYYELGPDNPPGFDAAIWQPAQDLAFTNDTPSHILIRRILDTARETLSFRLMGPSLGRDVELQAWRGDEIAPPPLRVEPSTELPPGEIEQTDNAIPGLRTVITRHVRLGGRVLAKDRFPSIFQPWPERWEVGQDEDGNFDPNLVPGYAEAQAAAEAEAQGEGAPSGEPPSPDSSATEQSANQS